MQVEKPRIARHKTAIRRSGLSLPVKCLLRDGLLSQDATLFDFGCGHGEDVALLRSSGFVCSGWDPEFNPNDERQPADVVNLGYVINVIEDRGERDETLQKAWDLCRRLLAVSAQIVVPGRGNNHVPFGDGVLTRLETFQKFFTQAELREYVEQQTERDPLPAAPGIFYVFKDESLRQEFVANRYRRRCSAPRKRVSELRFEQHRDMLVPLMETVTELGRLSEPDECENAEAIIAEFGTLKRAFALIRRVTGSEEWETIRRRRTEDLLVYLALAQFRRRPQLSRLPLSIQRDIRAFFGTYKNACQQADDLLFTAGDAEAIDEACKRSPVGKLLPNALYVHQSAMESLEPLLRIYEGCARAYLGEIDGANIIKLHRHSGKTSYLIYPDFDTDPHPALLRCVKLSLRSRDLNCYDYSQSNNPPILHRKDSFVTPDYPSFEKFARVTKQEEKQGLLDDTSRIGTRNGWDERLGHAGYELRGHRLIRRPPTGHESSS